MFDEGIALRKAESPRNDIAKVPKNVFRRRVIRITKAVFSETFSFLWVSLRIFPAVGAIARARTILPSLKTEDPT